MKALFFLFSLAAALIALPVVAQQGPAGVPGAPGLAPPPVVTLPPPPTVTAAPLPVAQAKPRQRRATTCNKGQAANQSPRCAKTRSTAADCHNPADAARCERYRKAREQCAHLLDGEHRQCLRDTLTAKK